ncbi:MAG: hypothetical protein ACRDQJ_18880 [Pseudonocardiaceae bacterium]
MTIAPIRSGEEWTGLRDAAVHAATRGWPVVPATYPMPPDGQWYGRDGASSPAPVYGDWQQHRIIDPEHAHREWTRRPFGVVLVWS